jgi:hypothetical protein
LKLERFRRLGDLAVELGQSVADDCLRLPGGADSGALDIEGGDD